MKKIATVLLAAVLCIGALTISVMAADSGNELGKVPGTTTEIILDGVKDEIYAKALYVNGSLSQNGKSEVTAKADYYLVYRPDALWIFCEIKDPTLLTQAADPKQPSFKVDSIEVMLDPTNEGQNIPEETPYQCRIDHNNLVSGRLGQKGSNLYLRSGSENGTVNFFDAQAVKTNGGFNAEFKIPLKSIAKGGKIGINLCYNDWDKDDGKRVVLGSTVKVESWNPDKYDYVTFGDMIVEPTPTQAPAATVVAPKTFDMAAVLVLVASVSCTASCSLIGKKRR